MSDNDKSGMDKDVLAEIRSFRERVEDFIKSNSEAHAELWKHIDGLKATTYGTDKYIGIRAQVELFKVQFKAIEDNEKKRAAREWTMVLILLGILIKQFIG